LGSEPTDIENIEEWPDRYPHSNIVDNGLANDFENLTGRSTVLSTPGPQAFDPADWSNSTEWILAA
jgi:hypothetical protein